MKNKFLMLLALTMFNSVLFAEDIILRHNKGLFGYKTVTTSHNAVGNYLSCLDPGKSSCKWSVSTLNNEYEDIVKKVDLECSNGSTSGSFQDDKYFVKYVFERDEDKLEIRIYTLNEARERGFI